MQPLEISHLLSERSLQDPGCATTISHIQQEAADTPAGRSARLIFRSSHSRVTCEGSSGFCFPICWQKHFFMHSHDGALRK
jgi:hypothetical protein